MSTPQSHHPTPMGRASLTDMMIRAHDVMAAQWEDCTDFEKAALILVAFATVLLMYASLGKVSMCAVPLSVATKALRRCIDTGR